MLDDIKNAVKNGNLIWQKHALEKMLERNISMSMAKQALLNGEVIEKYDDDKPYPSFLILGWVSKVPYHVVTSFDLTFKNCYIITAYQPDLNYFMDDFKTRRNKK